MRSITLLTNVGDSKQYEYLGTDVKVRRVSNQHGTTCDIWLADWISIVMVIARCNAGRAINFYRPS